MRTRKRRRWRKQRKEKEPRAKRGLGCRFVNKEEMMR